MKLLMFMLSLIGTTFTRCENDTTPADFKHGDTVNLIMDLTRPGFIDRCLDAGGEPILYPTTNVLICEDTDF